MSEVPEAFKNLSPEQKDALARALGMSEQNLAALKEIPQVLHVLTQVSCEDGMSPVVYLDTLKAVVAIIHCGSAQALRNIAFMLSRKLKSTRPEDMAETKLHISVLTLIDEKAGASAVLVADHACSQDSIQALVAAGWPTEKPVRRVVTE